MFGPGREFYSLKSKVRAAVFILSSLLLIVFYYPLLFHPGTYIFDLQGDGLNSWYIIKYQLLHGSFSTEFHGMNYPFTESIYHLDAQPFLLFIFKLFNPYFNLAEHFVPVIYYLVLFSIPVAAFCIAEVLMYYGMLSWLVVPVATGIALMSPQIHRIYAHIGLAYSFVIPVVWFLYLKYTSKRKRGTLLWLIFAIVISGFIHPYYIGLAAIVLFILILIEKKESPGSKLLLGFYMIAIPIGIYFLIVSLGYEGSVQIQKLPYGAFGQAYRSRPEDVFTPGLASDWQKLFDLSWIAHASWEGEAFIGFALLFPGLVYLVSFLTGIFRKSERKKLNPFRTTAGLFLFPMLLFVFTAGALHFILPVSIKNIFPGSITQFRAYGRIAWIIYYMLCVFFSLKFYAWYRAWRLKKNYTVSLISVLIFLIIYALDVAESNTRAFKYISEKKFARLDDSIDRLAKNVNHGSYQAIIALPYFHKISGLPEEREPANDILWPAYELSVLTGLPLTDANASRTSMTLAAKQLDFWMEKDKEIFNYYLSRKPFLIVTTQKDKEAIEQGTLKDASFFTMEKKVLMKSQLIDRTGEFLLFEISYRELLLMQ